MLPVDVIETSRLLLQRWDDAHYDDFLNFMRDPDVIRYIRPLPLSEEKGAEHHLPIARGVGSARIRQACGARGGDR